MTLTLREAKRSQVKLRIGISGTAGSGKTYSALLLASGLAAWEKICVIDSENMSADLYEHLGKYKVITIDSPYSPERYIEAIRIAEDAGMEVIIVDSISHEWEGEGGCLELAESLGGYPNGWKKVTPRHNKFKQTLLTSKAHMITTARRKQEYEMEKGDNGKVSVQKKGLKEITREGYEYEVTVNFNIETNHLATASKDRTNLFIDKPDFLITQETGILLKGWAEKGLSLEDYLKQLSEASTPEIFREIYVSQPYFHNELQVKVIIQQKKEEFEKDKKAAQDEKDKKTEEALTPDKTKPVEENSENEISEEEEKKIKEEQYKNTLKKAIESIKGSETLDQFNLRKHNIKFKSVQKDPEYLRVIEEISLKFLPI